VAAVTATTCRLSAGQQLQRNVPLENGNNAIKVWAADAAGNVGIARKSLVLGPALPVRCAQTMVTDT